MTTTTEFNEKVWGRYGPVSRDEKNLKRYNKKAIQAIDRFIDGFTTSNMSSISRLSLTELRSIAERLDLYALWLKDNPGKWYKGGLKHEGTGSFCLLGVGVYACEKGFKDPSLDATVLKKSYDFDKALAYPKSGATKQAFNEFVWNGLVDLNDNDYVDIVLMTTMIHRSAAAVRAYLAQREAGVRHPNWKAIVDHTFWRQRKTAGLVKSAKSNVKKGSK